MQYYIGYTCRCTVSYVLSDRHGRPQAWVRGHLTPHGNVVKYFVHYTYYLALRSSSPLWNNGNRFRQRTRSAAIVSFSLQLTPLACKSLNVDRQVFFGRPFSSAVSWCPLNCTAGWAFWCHPHDMTRKPEPPLVH